MPFTLDYTAKMDTEIVFSLQNWHIITLAGQIWNTTGDMKYGNCKHHHEEISQTTIPNKIKCTYICVEIINVRGIERGS